MPSWPDMQDMMAEELFKTGAGKHIHESKGKKYPHGCVFTDYGSYISERYAGEHGDSYAKVSLLHEQTLQERIDALEKYLPGLKKADIKRPFSVLDPLLLTLCLMVNLMIACIITIIIIIINCDCRRVMGRCCIKDRKLSALYRKPSSCSKYFVKVYKVHIHRSMR